MSEGVGSNCFLIFILGEMFNDSSSKKLLRFQVKDSNKIMMRRKSNSAHGNEKNFISQSFFISSFR